MLTNLSPLDIIIILAYFGVILWIAKWAAGSKSESRNATDYFLAGKSQGWLVVGASLFASNIGSEIILGVSGAGARGEMPQANFEILAALILILFGWVFIPFYLRTGVFTMPEFLEKRYNRACRIYLSVVSILAYVITKISLIIFAGALVFETIGIPFWTGAIVTVLLTGGYTVLGGLKAVIYTDMVQAFVLILGCGLVTIFGLHQIGGWSAMMETIEAASLTTGSPPADGFFNLWRPASDSDYPWTGIIFGAPILGIWYWCTDQYIVQRALSAKDISNARRGALFAGFLKILPVFVFFIPGVIAYSLYQKGAISFSMESADQALPALITQILPSGIKGIAIAGLLAALMSSLSSAFNSSSTLLTIDFYQKYRPNADQKDLVRFGQTATVVLVILSLGWIPFMESLMDGGIFRYLQGIQANISPPIAAVFLFGLLFKWINGHGAIVSLWTGFVIGMTRIVCEIMAGAGTLHVSEGSFLSIFLGINFLHFAFFLFIFCAVVLMVVSKITTPQSEADLALVTFDKSTRTAFQWTSDVTWTVVLIVSVLVIWTVFSPWGIAG